MLQATTLLLVLFGCCWIQRTAALSIDNEVVGVPTITCSENAITFSVRSRNLFRGNIYIKGSFNVPQCRQEYLNNDYSGASFSVRIGDCGMRRIRQLQPHGMNYMIVFVTNFHPQFVTKVDRAYNVRCFYAQQDKTVTTQLDLSMIPTQSLEQSTMLLPNCEYTVRQGSLNGQRVRYAQVGDRLVHRWECDNPNFGMLVKNCFVNDGSGSNVRVLDSRGCPVFTPVIQGPLQYDNSLNLAFVEVWAYKFPDRPQLYFQCQIQVCNKRDNECVGITPPNCPNVPKANFRPNSVVDRNTFPVRVRGTFPGPTGAASSSANVDPTRRVVGPVAYRGTSGRVANLAQPASLFVEQNKIVGAGQSTGNFGSHTPVVRDEKTSNSGRRPVNLQPARQLGEPAGRSAPQNGSRERRPKRFKRQAEERLKGMGHKIEVWKQMSELLRLRERERQNSDDGETMDVVASPVFVAEREDDPDDDPEFTHFPFGSHRRQESAPETTATLCLNQMGVGLLSSCFTLMLLIICSLLFHLFYRRRLVTHKSRLLPSNRSTASSASFASTVTAATTVGWLPLALHSHQNSADTSK